MNRNPAAVLVARVKPNARRPGIRTDHLGVTIDVAARPVEGAANDAARRCLADVLGVPMSAVQLIRGHRSRTKTFTIAGMTDAQLRAGLFAERP